MYTIEQYNALTEAIATGSFTVKYADKEVTYRSLKEMLTIKNIIKGELFPSTTNTRRKLASYSKGIYPSCNE
ncbi:MAG: phage head-tail joining protein [Bacteroidales bacterium]